MAIIYSYPQIGELATGDTIAISDASNGNKTKSVTIGQLDSYINTGQATIIQVDDRVVTGASFNTGSGLLTLTRNGGDIPSVTTNLDGRYYLSSNPNSYTSNLGVVQSLTTNFTSGAATLVGGVLNIPQYSGGGGGGITEITTTAPITGGPITTTGTIGITLADGLTDGYLSSTDWNTFNNKSTFDGQFSSLSNKPTTIAGYGITDALQLGVTSTTALAGNTTTITNTQAAAIVTNSGKTSFPGFGITAGTALEGNTVIPAAYTNADVDAHLNTSTAGNNDVLSWTGSDYDWVAQSGGGSGTVTSVAATHAGNAFTATIGNVSTLNPSVDITLNGSSSQYIDGTGNLTTFPTITTGTVESVGLSMPAAFSVANSPVTISGTLTVTGAGTTSEYVDGTGALQTFPTIPSSTSDLTNDSGFVEGTTSTQTAITEIKTLTSVEYATITPSADVMYVIV